MNVSENTTDRIFETENKSHVNVLLLSLYHDNSQTSACEDSLDELQQLAETSIGEDAVNSKFFKMMQCRPSIDPATFVGYGKAVEAGKICADNEVSLVVVDSELSPSQIRNLEKEINNCFEESKRGNVKVIDRTMLILDIFAKHAVTGEGKLQVEIAQLKYTVPRLTGNGINMSRQGGTSGSIGARGPGETKLETDRRHI